MSKANHRKSSLANIFRSLIGPRKQQDTSDIDRLFSLDDYPVSDETRPSQPLTLSGDHKLLKIYKTIDLSG